MVKAPTLPLSRRARARAREAAGNQRPWPADKVERWAIDRLIPYAKNARRHTEAQVAAVAASIKKRGWTTRAGPRRRNANTSPPSRARAPAREAAGNQRPWPADKVERWAIDRLIPYAIGFIIGSIVVVALYRALPP